ncbi:MAG: M16 family metallopeptidase [Gemmatimonadota bacterium]
MLLSGCSWAVSTAREPETGEGTVEIGARAGRPGAGDNAQREGLVDRTKVPDIGEPSPLELPRVEDYTLEYGLRVILVERHELPLVNIQLLFPGGADAHAPAEAGLAAFTADMLDEGTANRTALEIADGLDLLGASFTTSAGYDGSSVRLSVLRPNFEDALEIVADVVMNPTFPEDDVERVRRERLTRIVQRRDRPAALADDAFHRVLYGEDHPYAMPLLGTPATLSALPRERLVAFHRERYRPGGATLVVVGDIEREDLDTLVARTFAGWEGTADPVAPPAAPPPATGGTLYLVDRPGSAQSEIRIGAVAAPRNTPAYVPLMVANTVLGGSFTSRLNQRIREEKGYSYGAYSYFDLRRGAGPFQAGAAVATPVTDSAVVEFLNVIEGMSREPAPDDELARARNYLAYRFPQHFETGGDVVARLAELALYGLPSDFYETYVPAVLDVKPEDVLEVARRYMDVAGMVVVIVGDRSIIEEPLRALGVGAVEILEDGAQDEADGAARGGPEGAGVDGAGANGTAS